MVTIGRTIPVAVGASEEMECHVQTTGSKFDLFVNPIVWQKVQLDEKTHINMMGNIQEPFASTHRLKVTFKEDQYNYFFGLTVSGE